MSLMASILHFDCVWCETLNLINVFKGIVKAYGVYIYIYLEAGASNHMTRYFSLLTDVDEVEPCPVGLHHGKNAIAVTEGTINCQRINFE